MPRMHRLAALLLSCCVAATGVAQPVTDLPADLPDNFDNATVGLRFVDIRPIKGKEGAGDVVVLLQRRDGQWTGKGHVAAADYNQKSSNSVDIGDLKLDDGRLSGKLSVRIGADSPRPSKKGFPQPDDVFEIEVDATLAAKGTTVGFEPDLEAFMPPWRKDVPTFGGGQLEGSYTAKRGDGSTEGDLRGGLGHAPTPGRWGAAGNAHIAKAGDAMAVHISLAPHRVAPPSAAWAELKFAEPQDWTGSHGLAVSVETDKPRTDAAVAVEIHVQGAWRGVTSAALLTQKRGEYLVPFDDFRYPVGDLSQVRGVRVGVDNPFGVGDVNFRLVKIERYTIDVEPLEHANRVTIHPGTTLSINGTTQVPRQLFGFHEVHLPKAETDAEKAKALAYIRELNPGYLRPLTHTGFGGKPLSDEQVKERLAEKAEPEGWRYEYYKAASALDSIIWTHTTDLWARPPWMDQDRDRFLGGVRTFYRNLASRGWTPGDDANYLRRLEVWNEPFMWGRHINMGFMNPEGRKAWTDESQHGYIPADLVSQIYGDIFLAAVDGAKSANPHVLIGGPSAPSFKSDYYSNLQHHVGPILDRVHDKIDFITEHHYGGAPASHAASYEVANAYMDVNHGRRVPIWNTEANLLHAPAPNVARYNLGEILHCINTVPDSTKGRALHALWSGELRSEGEVAAYTLLATLRGTMLPIDIDFPGVVGAAAMPSDGRVVLVLYREGGDIGDVELQGLDGFNVVETIALIAEHKEAADHGDTEGQALPPVPTGKLDMKPVSFKLGGATLPKHTFAIRVTLDKPGHKPTKTRRITKHYINTVLTDVAPGKPAKAIALWRGDEPWKNAKKATLRVITRDVHREEATATLGKQKIALPWSSSNDGWAFVQDIPIDTSLLDHNTTLTFEVAESKRFNGYTVYAALIMLEH